MLPWQWRVIASRDCCCARLGRWRSCARRLRAMTSCASCQSSRLRLSRFWPQVRSAAARPLQKHRWLTCNTPPALPPCLKLSCLHNAAPQASAGLNGVVSGVGRCQLCMMIVHERGMKLTARTQSNDWADDEFGEADFGDARLTQRLAALARKISQDPSQFNLPHLPATEGLGLGTGGNRHGFMIHSQLAVSPEGLPLGVLGMKTWVRA